MIKPYHLLISALLGGLAVYFLMRLNGKETGSIKEQKIELKKDRNELVKLAVFDSAWERQVRQLRDSVVYHKKQVRYLQSRYKAPIEVTKGEIAFVFQEDSITITKEVKKGFLCDSLQREQALEINSLDKENLALDSLIRVKNETIKYALKMDSVHVRIELALHKKIVNRTIGEAVVGVIAILFLIFHY